MVGGGHLDLDSLYVQLCKWAGRYQKLRRKTSEDLARNLEFLGFDLEAEEVAALATLSASTGIAAILVATLAVIFIDLPIIILIALAPLPIFLFVAVGWYPKWRAENRQALGLGEIPRLVSYLVMTLRVNPNLERSAQFTASRVDGPLGWDLRKELWGAYLRVHESVEEALSRFARHWSERCKELKRSIYLLKTSILERDQTARLNTLDRALELSLEGMRERMKEFASGLYLPTMVIYSIGILLPLVLLAVLPALSIINFQIGATELALSYCVIIPLTVYGLGKYTLAKRPASFQPPKVPLQRGLSWNELVAGVTAITLLTLGFWLRLPPVILALLMLWAMTICITVHLYLSSSQAYRLRLKNERAEEEFCDALVQLGNQMSQGRPAEDVFQRVAETAKGDFIAGIFRRAAANVRLGGMKLRATFFDPDEGALKEVHSPVILETLRMLLDAMEKGARTTGQTILRTAKHLKELKGVELEIRRSFGEITSSMHSVALFFAPMVAAVTARLQELLTTKASGTPFLGGASIPFAALLGVLGFYVIVLTSVLISYSIEIERGNDEVLKHFAIARALPAAMGVFTLGIIISGQVLSFMLG